MERQFSFFFFSLTSRDKEVNGFVVGILAGDGVVPTLYGLPVLGGYLLPQAVEAVHGVFELLYQPVDHGGPSTVRRRPGSATRQSTVSFVGAVQCLQSELDELGFLKSESHVGVHARPKVLHFLSLVKALALLVRATEALVEPFQLLELILEQLHLLEELVEVDALRQRRHLDDMVVVRRDLLVAGAGEGA